MKTNHEIYKLIQDRLIKSKDGNNHDNICLIINQLYNEDILCNKEFLSVLSDLGKRNPLKCDKYSLFKFSKQDEVPGGYWYPINNAGYQYRLLLLNRIIKDTTPKSNWLIKLFC